MTRAKKNRVWYLSALVAALALSLAAFWYFSGPGAYGGAFRVKILSVSVRAGERVLLSDEGAFPCEGGEALTLCSREKNAVSYLLLAGERVLSVGTLLPDETKTIDQTPAAGEMLSLALKTKERAIAYLSSAASVLPAAAHLPEGGDLIFVAETHGDALFLSAPYRLFGSFSFTSLSIVSDRAGRIVLAPDAPYSGDVMVDAPACRVFWRSFTPTFSEGMENYYLTAVSWNGKRLDPLSFPVENYTQLLRLSSPAELPRLPENAAITTLHPFRLEDSLSFSAHVSLLFREPVSFGEYALSFVSPDPGEYRIKTLAGASVSAESMTFDSPRSDLIWESEGARPAFSTVQKIYNLASYDHTPLTLGGTGTGLPRLTVFATEKNGLEEDLDFEVCGNLLCAEAPFLVSLTDLDDSPYALSCSGGSAVLAGSLSAGVVKTRDAAGAERSFALALCREATEIPNVYLETENEVEITSKSQYVSASFAMEGGEEERVAETSVRIRGRGNSTWKWDKKPYKISFDEPVSLFGLPAARAWALFANYADKSLMRNRVASVMASELSFAYQPTQHFVNVFLNGKYIGVYGLGEHLEEGPGRVEITHDETALDCGFFLEAGGVVSGVNVQGVDYFHAGLVKFILIKSPEPDTITSEQIAYIRSYMEKADAAVKKGEGYEEYLDMDTLIDWMIMTEWTNNTDCAWRRSTYFQKNPGGKLVMGPVWDFDLAFGNFSKDKAPFISWVSFSEDDDYVGETWSTYLLRDPEFKAAFKKRFQEVRDRVLRAALEEIDRDAAILEQSAELNFSVWNILGRKVAFERHDTTRYPTYESQIEYLKGFLQNRADWIDLQIIDW